MAFDQSRFSPIGGNASPSPSVYSYFTDDSLSTVTAVGYFTDKVSTLDEGDIILAVVSDVTYVLAVGADSSSAENKTPVSETGGLIGGDRIVITRGDETISLDPTLVLDQHFKGPYLTLTALQTAYPTASLGDWAIVDDSGPGDATMYQWDDDGAAWVNTGFTGLVLADNLTTNDPTQGLAASQGVVIKVHIDDTTVHFTQAAISIPASQISDFDVEVGNNTDVAANTAARHAAVTLNADDATQETLNLSTQEIQVNLATGSTDGAMPAEDKTKTDHITVTQAVDLDTIETDTGLNNTHRTSDGSDHTFIDQDVRTTASPEFVAVRDLNRVGSNGSTYGTTLPTNALWCDGQAVSRTTYADLFAEIGTTYGVGDGSTTFNVPDDNTQNYFIRANSTAGGTGGDTSHDHGGATAGDGATKAVQVGILATAPTNGHVHSISSDDHVPPYRNQKFYIWY